MTRGEESSSLRAARHEIEQIDRALVLLVAARLEAAGSAIRIRSERDGQISDPSQEQLVLSRARAWAEQADVPPWLVETVFRAMVKAGKERFVSRRTQSFTRENDAPDRQGRFPAFCRSVEVTLTEPRHPPAVRKS
jgi:chorismate mutase